MEPNGIKDKPLISVDGENKILIAEVPQPVDAESFEAPREIINEEAVYFSEETKAELERRGFIIYELDGKTVEELTGELGVEWVNMHETHMLHKKAKSYKGQIAFKPGFDESKSYINEKGQTAYKPSEDGARSLCAEFLGSEQAEGAVMDYDEAVMDQVPGARAVMASMGTTLAFIAKHREETQGNERKQYLFNQSIYGESVLLRTSTPDNNGWNKLVVEVGDDEESFRVRSVSDLPNQFTPRRTYGFVVPDNAVAA